mgnify:FL=1
MSPRFVMISRWRLETTAERVWELLVNPTEWPAWWPQVARVERLANGDSDGVGSRHSFVWRSGLGYGLRIVITNTRVERCRELEGTASGDLHGLGLWLIDESSASEVRITYRWDVELSKTWMRLLAPLLQRVFARRHCAVMAKGAHGMARRLRCRLSEIEDWSKIYAVGEDLVAR